MDIRNYFPAPNANKKQGKKNDVDKKTTKKGSKRRIHDSADELSDYKTSEVLQTTKSTSTPTRQSTRNQKKTKVEDEPVSTPKKEQNKVARNVRSTKSNVKKESTMEIDEISPSQSTSENPEIFTTPKRSTRKVTESTPKATKKRTKAKIIDDDDDDDDDDLYIPEEPKSPSPLKKVKHEQKEVPVIKTPRSTRKGKVHKVDNDGDEKDIGPTTTPPSKVRSAIKVEGNDSPDIKIDYLNRTAESKEIPQGEEMCLAGKTFVFTGDLSMEREEAQDLVKRHGGRVTSQPSSRTSYVVVGQDPGPKKMEKVEQFKITTLNEDQLFELIRTSPKKSDPNAAAGINKPQKSKAPITKISDAIDAVSPSAPANVTQLWTEKYRPKTLRDFCGNPSLIKDMAKWLNEWDKKSFKFKSKEWMPALLIAGSPGIGKTSSVRLIADLERYKIVELNASDTRSKKKLETAIKVATKNTSITGFFQPVNDKSSGKEHANEVQTKALILMDEIDGMSAGDRGGIAELIQLIKKTKVPIICICNDINSMKLKSLKPYCHEVKFSKPRVEQVRSRIMTIATRENLQVKSTDVDELIRGANSDIRQILNLLSTWKINHDSINYDEVKDLNKINERHIKKNIFEITKDFLGNDIWKSRKNTINDKLKLYFQEHDLAPLMIFENYIKMKSHTIPKFIKEYDNKDASPDALEKLATLESFTKAADAMSYGDIVNKRIRGSQPEWSLMPMHGFLSTIAPAYHVHGYCKGGQFGQYKFPSWLGQYSKATKIHRQLKEIQSHMRTKISADRSEVRESYIPTLRKALIKPLVDKKSEGVSDVIKIMDQYMITKEQFDIIMEFKDKQTRYNPTEIASSLKATFTKKYNASSHPIPFLNVSNVIPTKTSKPVITADMDDFINEEDVPDDDDVIIDDDDLTKDRLIVQPSVGRGGGRGGRGGGRGGRGGGRGGNSARGGSSARGEGRGRGGRGSRGRGRK